MNNQMFGLQIPPTGDQLTSKKQSHVSRKEWDFTSDINLTQTFINAFNFVNTNKSQ